MNLSLLKLECFSKKNESSLILTDEFWIWKDESSIMSIAVVFRVHLLQIIHGMALRMEGEYFTDMISFGL